MGCHHSQELETEKRSSLVDYHQFCKVITIGDPDVGKTSFLLRLCRDCFYEEPLQSIGVDFLIKMVKLDDDTVVKLQLWDTAGHEKFRAITSNYYKGAHIVLVFYDPTNIESFKNVQGWLKKIHRYADEGTLVGISFGVIDLL
eukprot:TRINITY_DN2920_c0_g1_i3.p1 TRINITY_DN2920_c0_g1~~TRINITY_DN2920_c0_g1_i3.p1  ORF type:complete len:154 (-),score=20.49 TRINITY_DN2920_c0_g1_i3:93-521(-)